MALTVQQKHFHRRLYFLFRTPLSPTLGLSGAPRLPPGRGPQVTAGLLGSCPAKVGVVALPWNAEAISPCLCC